MDPGSEWRLHRHWFEHSAMGDLLGADFSLVEKNAFYRCLDKLLDPKAALFSHLRQRWQDLIAARFDVLLYLRPILRQQAGWTLPLRQPGSPKSPAMPIS
jgi:hypothetical protein